MLTSGVQGRASVPSGMSTGRHEAVELRDHSDPRYRGLAVVGAVAHVTNVIGPNLVGVDASDQTSVDGLLNALDGTADKSRLGANAILAVSLAAARASAADLGLPLWRYLNGNRKPRLPRPMVNILSGGMHAGHNLDFQDFLVVPASAETFSDALQTCVEFYWAMRDLLREQGLNTLRADEGGFGPQLHGHREALELMVKAAQRASLQPGRDVQVAIDVAASHFYLPDRTSYQLVSEDKVLRAEQLVDLLEGWVTEYPICSIEDGLAEDDWNGWRELTSALGNQTQLIGDDLFATNVARLRKGVDMQVANAALVKMNQVGTLTETIEFISTARHAGYGIVVSARSGETEDATMADLAVATAADQIKIGSVTGSERLAKYNQLLRIEEELGDAATLAPFEIAGRRT